MQGQDAKMCTSSLGYETSRHPMNSMSNFIVVMEKCRSHAAEAYRYGGGYFPGHCKGFGRFSFGEGWFRLADCSLGMWIYNQSGWLVVGDVRSFWLGSEVADFRFKFSSWFLWVMVEQCRTFIQVLQTARLARSSAGVINWLIHIYIYDYIYM